MFKKTLFVFMALVLVISLFACTDPTGQGGDDTDAGAGNAQPSSNPVVITLLGDSITADNSSALTISGSTLTVNAPGTYKLSGNLTDGNIIIDTLEKGDVFLILAGVDITCSDFAPIFCKQAKNFYVVLEEGSTNKLTDGSKYTLPLGDDEPDAALFSKDDLFIQGSGELIIDANYNDGITGKDDVNIESGKITVNAANHGIKGKDSLEIKGGFVDVTAIGDGLKSTQDNDAILGFVEIRGGTVKIKAGDEGIQAYTNVIITGGKIEINSVDSAVKSEVGISISAGELSITSYDNPFSSAKIEGNANANITVNGKKHTF